MSYRFVEHKYPDSDPNIDLNFNNDILYSDISGDKYIDYVNQYKNSDVIPTARAKKQQVKKQNTDTVYVVFLLIVIALIILWYYYGQSPSSPKSSIVDTYPDVAELTMMSPDVGANVIYRNVN
jgi:hypothetical protein